MLGPQIVRAGSGPCALTSPPHFHPKRTVRRAWCSGHRPLMWAWGIIFSAADGSPRAAACAAGAPHTRQAQAGAQRLRLCRRGRDGGGPIRQTHSTVARTQPIDVYSLYIEHVTEPSHEHSMCTVPLGPSAERARTMLAVDIHCGPSYTVYEDTRWISNVVGRPV